MCTPRAEGLSLREQEPRAGHHPGKRQRYAREKANFYTKYHEYIDHYDPYYNPHFNNLFENFRAEIRRGRVHLFWKEPTRLRQNSQAVGARNARP